MIGATLLMAFERTAAEAERRAHVERLLAEVFEREER